MQFANGTNQIATVFKSTDKGIDSWIEKGSANSSTSEPLTSRDNSHTVAVVRQNPTDIINYIKERFKFSIKNSEDRNLIMAHASKFASIDNVLE